MPAYDMKFWNLKQNIFLKVESNILKSTEVIFKLYFWLFI